MGKQIVITLQEVGVTGTWQESFDADDLICPSCVGRSRFRDAYPHPVETQEQAELYAEKLIRAFNNTRRHEKESVREVVAVRFQQLEP